MFKSIIIGIALSIILIVSSCSKQTATSPRLIFKYKLDSTQARLNNFGVDTPIIAGHWGQSPTFHKMGAHYIELSPSPYTPLGGGAVIYTTPATTAGGSTAIDFTQEAMGNDGDVFFSVPISSLASSIYGTSYQYLRVSLAYQNYDVTFRVDTTLVSSGVNVPIH